MRTDETRKKALKGTVWTFFGYGGSQAIRLGSNLVLAHLLFPEAFGLMALVNIFIQGLHMFSDMGLGPSIIQNRRGDDPDFLNTAWTIQVIRGIALWFGFCLIAWPVAKFFGHDSQTTWLLFWIMPAIGFSTVISGFNSTSLSSLERTLQLDRITMLEMVPQLTSVITMLLWSWLHPSVWALVGGSIAYSLVQLPMSHWFNRPLRNKFHWDLAAVAELRRFGKWIFFGTIVAFLSSNLDRIILGKLLTLTELGVYGMALTFARFGTEISTRLSGTVLFPILSRSQDDPVTLVGRSLKARGLVLLAGGSLACAFAITAPLFFRYLYDHRYANAGVISQWMAILAWCSIVLSTMDRIPMALGHSRALFVSNILIVFGYGFAVLGYWIALLPGFILGLCLGQLIPHLVLMTWIPIRRGDMLLQTLLYSAIFIVYGGAGVLGMGYLAKSTTPFWEISTGLVVAAGPCIVSGVLVLKRLKTKTS